jgi:hypothetical protein
MDIAEALTATYLPALTSVARAQANATFAGHYRHTSLLTTNPPITNTTTTPLLLNSSLTITLDPTGSKPGLGIENWLSNGTDMARIAVAINANVSAEYMDKMQPSVRLYPTGLEEKMAVDGGGGGKRVAFKAVFEDVGLPEASGSFGTDCSSW